MSTRWWKSLDSISDTASHKLKGLGRLVCVCDLLRSLSGDEEELDSTVTDSSNLFVLCALIRLGKYSTVSHNPGPTAQF